MSVIEKSGVMKYKDKDGQVYIMLPITTADKVDGAVSFYEQELTEEEKAQARANIGAISADEVPESGGSEQIQSDYDQNDSSAMDYIKNRPFYDVSETVFDKDVTTVSVESSIYYEQDTEIVDTATVEDGDIYEVIVDSTTYLYELDTSFIYFGNLYLYIEQASINNDMTIEEYTELMEQMIPGISAKVVDTGEKFFIGIISGVTDFYTTEAGTYHFTISKITDLKQLDEKYIPDTIARVSDIPTGGADIDLTNIPNLYTWKRYSSSPKEYTETEQTNVAIHTTATMGVANVYYASNISIADGSIVNKDFELFTASDVTKFDVLKGNYVRVGITLHSYYYIPEDATFTLATDSLTVDKAYLIGVNSNIGTFIDYVSSEESNAYPTSGQHTDGNWYEYYKQLGSNGIYIGSGDMPEGCVIQIDPDGEYEGETSEGSGKTLIGEVILTSSNVTKTEDNMLTFNDELEAQLTEILSAIDESRGIIYVEQTILDMVNTSICSYMSDSVDLVTKKTIDFAFLNDAATGSVMYNSLRADNLRFNISGYYDYVVSGDLTISMKFYTISGGSVSSSDNTSVAEEELPAVTTEDNGKVLMVVDGKWAIGSLSTSGTALPSAEEASF